MTSGLVTAVHFRNNQILATVSGKEVPLSSIIEVKQPEPLNNTIDALQQEIPLSDVVETTKLVKL
jgi:hypothetical protein